LGVKVTRKDIIWNYLGTILSLGSNFIVLPIIIYFLDSESIGLWYVFLSLGGIVILFDFGFNPTLSRNVAYSWSGAKELSKKGVLKVDSQEPNIYLLKKVLKTCKWIYLAISALALIVLLTIGTTYVMHISQGLDKISVFSAWFVYSISIFFSLYYGYYITFLRGVGAIREVNIATILSRLIQILTSIMLLYLGLGLLAVAIANLVYGLVFRLLSKKFFYQFHFITFRLCPLGYVGQAHLRSLSKEGELVLRLIYNLSAFATCGYSGHVRFSILLWRTCISHVLSITLFVIF